MNKIVILNHSIRGCVSNENTLWSMLADNIPGAIGISINELKIPLAIKLKELNPDLIIQNANLGKINGYKTISFLQDPLIKMKGKYETFQDIIKSRIKGRETLSDKLKKQIESFEGNIKITNSDWMAFIYRKHGEFNVIPMGVDVNLFKPMDKKEMKIKYSIPLEKHVCIFVGSTHKIKGFEEIKIMISSNPKSFWILVLKDIIIPDGKNYKVFSKISQEQLAELYNCADICVSRSEIESFGLSMVEALMCDIPLDNTNVGVFWNWKYDYSNPRKSAIEKGLDMQSCLNNWKQLINQQLNDL